VQDVIIVGDDTEYEMMLLRRALPKFDVTVDLSTFSNALSKGCDLSEPKLTPQRQLSYTIIIQALSDGLGYGLWIALVTSIKL